MWATLTQGNTIPLGRPPPYCKCFSMANFEWGFEFILPTTLSQDKVIQKKGSTHVGNLDIR